MLAVDEDVLDAARASGGLLAFGRSVADLRRIEDHDVRRLAHCEHTAIANAKTFRAGSGHPANRRFQIEEPAITHERPQDSRERSERRRIRVPTALHDHIGFEEARLVAEHRFERVLILRLTTVVVK